MEINRELVSFAEDVSSDMEKAKFILGELLNEFDWVYEPDASLAIAYGSGQDKSNQARWSWNYIYSYRKIMTMIMICSDYICMVNKKADEICG